MPWSAITAVERKRWGLRIHTTTGMCAAHLPQDGQPLPMLHDDDPYRTVLHWWQTYGDPPPGSPR
jgi:hypothetical protein